MKGFVLLVAVATVSLAACGKNDAGNSMASNDMMADNVAANDMMANSAAPSAASVDAAFVADAIKGDNSEVAMGKLAMEKGSSQAVKDLGQMLITDHGAHLQKLAPLAAAASVTVTDETMPEAKAAMDKLSGLSGAAFDKQFAQTAIDDHEKDIAKYETQAKSSFADSAALAKDTLPTLRKHLDAAKAI